MEKYGLIVADPPWTFADPLAMSDVPRGAEANYTTMTADDIIKLPVRDVAADDAVLLLWVPASLLSVGMCTMDSYGFSQRQIWVWVKTAKGEEVDAENIHEDTRMAFGMGRLARNACEIALVGVRGKVYAKLENRSVRNVFFAPNLKHSAKPDKVQAALASMFPSMRKLELFSRRPLDGWRTVGWEDSSSGEDVRDFLVGKSVLVSLRGPTAVTA